MLTALSDSSPHNSDLDELLLCVVKVGAARFEEGQLAPYRRCDEALYAAKNSGRDCARIPPDRLGGRPDDVS